MRILIAFEDEYRGLRELIAFVFRGAAHKTRWRPPIWGPSGSG